MNAWERFREWSSTLADLGGTAALLGWDRETRMAAGGADSRGHQQATVAAMFHRELVRPDMDGALNELDADDTLTAAQAREVRLRVRQRTRGTRIPERLVRELSAAESRCVTVWLDARPKADFASFRGPLEQVVRLKREQATALSDGGEPYDALLDDFEAGCRAVDLEPVFTELRNRLAPLVRAAAERPRTPLPVRRWPGEAQMAFSRDVAELMGYDMGRGEIALSAHPFTATPGFGDVRFTTRIDEADPVGSIMSVMHETGHALYEQGFPPEVARTALADAPSMGAHESQSRFWENHVGRCRAFWHHMEPMLRGRFPEAMRDVTPDQLYAHATAVQPSLVRVEADEVTYNLHIALRFELELGLLRGELAVDDLPGEWNRRMTDLLGVTPPDDGLGVMQDIHWPEGLFGYFPTYTLGNLYSAQLGEAADAALGGVRRLVGEGRFPEILEFMREHIHRRANLVPTDQLMRDATGVALSADALVRHLERVGTD